MNFLETLQTQSKEDATKALFDILNSKAMDALSSLQEEQIDEVNRSTLSSYINKAKDSNTITTIKAAGKQLSGDKEGHKDAVSKIKKRNVGIETANQKLKEDVESIDEGLRKLGEYSQGRHKATTHKDTEWGEYRVKFHTDGKHLPDADYHTDDKEDATDTAKHQVDQLHAKDSE